MLLVIDSATAACSVALIEGDQVTDARHEVVGRGHAEKLLPMIEDMLGARRPDAILVDCGPGSFTGVRVGLAAAQGLAIGWGVPVHGYSSTALIAAGADGSEVAVALIGGHGQIFVQSYRSDPLEPTGPLQSLTPEEAATVIATHDVHGSGAEMLVNARGFGIAWNALPSARDAWRLPDALRALPPRPIYGRAPDAKPMTTEPISIVPGTASDLDAVMRVMEESFDPAFGEAWTSAQCAGLLPLAGVWLSLARRGEEVVGFSLSRVVLDEAELLLLAVAPNSRRQGVGRLLLDRFALEAKKRGASRLHLEVRDGNHAIQLYMLSGFSEAGRRYNYYSGRDGRLRDALTLARKIKR